MPSNAGCNTSETHSVAVKQTLTNSNSKMSTDLLITKWTLV